MALVFFWGGGSLFMFRAAFPERCDQGLGQISKYMFFEDSFGYSKVSTELKEQKREGGYLGEAD